MRITSWGCLLLLYLFLNLNTLSAQTYVDLISTGFNQNLKTQYKGFDNQYEQQTSWLNANIPFVLNGKGDILMPNLQYNFTQLKYDFFEEDKLSFHNISLGINWLK